MVADSGGMRNVEERWARFPIWWCRTLRGKPTAMAVAACLSAHTNAAGEAWPTIGTIAAQLTIHPNRIAEALAVLVDTGIVVRRRRCRQSYLYYVNYNQPNYGELPECGDTPRSGTHNLPDLGEDNPPGSRRGNRSGTDHGTITSTTFAQKHKFTPEPSADLIASMAKLGYDRDAATIQARSVLATVGSDREALLIRWITCARVKRGIKNPLSFAIAQTKNDEVPVMTHQERSLLDLDGFEESASFDQMMGVESTTQHYLRRLDRGDLPHDVKRALSELHGAEVA
jgi:hypothetical protein